MADRLHLQRLMQELTDNGKLIEAGWVSLRLAAIPLDAPPIQLEEMRNAFFGGAHHLFASIISILEDDAKPTQTDLDRMSLINDELQTFIQGFELKHFPAKGTA